MPPRERAVDRGTRRGRRLTIGLGLEVRDARLLAGLTQKQAGAPCGMSASYVGKIERAEAQSVSLTQYARLCSVLGLDLAVKAYPVSQPLRDAAHVALLGRLRALLHPSLTWRTEVPMPQSGDLRTWDAQIVAAPLRIGVEAETRMHDFQALDRRIMLKQRDSGVDRVLLILADTRSNRAFLGGYSDAIRANYPVSGGASLEALAAGRDPGGNAIAVL